MENPLHYRNKAQYPIGINKQGEPVIGVLPIEHMKLFQ